MRILHAHSGNLYGGVETMLLALARYSGPDIEHVFALCFEGRFSSELRQDGRSVEFVGNVHFSRPWTATRARRGFRALLAANRPDAVVVHSAWGHALFAKPTRSAGVPLVHFLHSPRGGPSWLERRARRNPPQLVICNSRHTCRDRQRLFPDSPSAVVHPPVPTVTMTLSPEERVALRRQLSAPDDAIVIVQVARLEPWKGQGVLLDALGRLREDGRWRCWFVGGAQRNTERRYAANLEAKAAALGIANRVAFLGERTDVPQVLQAADIFCHPNTAPEPFGIVFIEALYAGLPIVAASMGGPLEIVDDTTGILVEPSAAAVRTALKALIDDAGRRQQMRHFGPDRARALCDPKRQADAFAKVISEHVVRGKGE